MLFTEIITYKTKILPIHTLTDIIVLGEIMRFNKITFSLAASILFHACTLILNWELPAFDFLADDISNPLKVRVVGENDGLKEDLIYIEQKTSLRQSGIKKRSMKLPALTPLNDQISKVIKSDQKQNLLQSPKPRAIENLRISNKTIKTYLQQNSNYQAPSKVLNAMDYTNVNFDLVVPKGVKEDELNKHEMVFYSFRRRTALAYVNSFYKELNNFERKNPHLQFPLTQSKQEIAGKITYDKNGDILKIETLKWTQINQLQNFFMDVLKNMSSLPNPPKEVINKKEEFEINFVLTLNESRTRR